MPSSSAIILPCLAAEEPCGAGTPSAVPFARERVFAYVSDTGQVPDSMFGLNKFDPLTEQTLPGVGSTFDASVKLGPKTLHTKIKCRMGGRTSRSRSGLSTVSVSMSWRFRGRPMPAPNFSVVFDYQHRAGPGPGTPVRSSTRHLRRHQTHTEAELLRGYRLPTQRSRAYSPGRGSSCTRITTPCSAAGDGSSALSSRIRPGSFIAQFQCVPPQRMSNQMRVPGVCAACATARKSRDREGRPTRCTRRSVAGPRACRTAGWPEVTGVEIARPHPSRDPQEADIEDRVDMRGGVGRGDIQPWRYQHQRCGNGCPALHEPLCCRESEARAGGVAEHSRSLPHVPRICSEKWSAMFGTTPAA